MRAVDGRGVSFALVGVLLTGATSPAHTQAPASAPVHDVTALARETQNPVGSLISVPMQFNFNTGGDLEDRAFFNLNLQPVIPFKLSTNWNVIARTIVPLDSLPGPDQTRFSGVGDIQQQIFITPAKPGGLIWGLGPTFSFPTATSSPVETGTWGGGFAAVVVKMTGPFVLGGLVSQIWPMTDAGGDPETNLLTMQPAVNYNIRDGWAMSFSPIITANWNAPAGNEWTVPLGVGITKTTVFNRRPMNIGVTYYYNLKRSDGAAGQQLRFTISLLYPK